MKQTQKYGKSNCSFLVEYDDEKKGIAIRDINLTHYFFSDVKKLKAYHEDVAIILDFFKIVNKVSHLLTIDDFDYFYKLMSGDIKEKPKYTVWIHDHRVHTDSWWFEWRKVTSIESAVILLKIYDSFWHYSRDFRFILTLDNVYPDIKPYEMPIEVGVNCIIDFRKFD